MNARVCREFGLRNHPASVEDSDCAVCVDLRWLMLSLFVSERERKELRISKLLFSSSPCCIYI